MGDANHVRVDLLGKIVYYHVILNIAPLRFVILMVTYAITVNLDTGDGFVQINAVTIVQAVAKATDIAASAAKVSGEMFVRIHVAKNVCTQRAEKVMDIAHIVKAGTGETCVTRHAVRIVN